MKTKFIRAVNMPEIAVHVRDFFKRILVPLFVVIQN